ncbi:adenylate/guanylate cyclase domain-containing protein [Hoyosella sp. YIM 151337]|uniref:adenylate/guanylate cyclase domain-containing protein n=1 Tax=Hoyosella sp. YIM 151337 TaxID=2992742 RepID=UPI002236C11E|nr:adenylate/guanylate cyclase domain-containing protein [Hoyosella sp. YIM 151337]MCW4351824.1 adenylate/guanylate cyclase domain-containing protein [Hoyosella sp. YIM 151337]
MTDNAPEPAVPEKETEPGAGQRVSEWLQRTDQNPHLVGFARRVRRALPGDPGFGDPLSTAGSSGPGRVARVMERVLDPAPGATREAGFGALQVWQAVLERFGRGRGAREVTIVFTDLVGFSSWALEAGDDATLRLLRKVAKCVETPIAEHRGQVVKRMGDGVMAVFPAPRLALEAAMQARAELKIVSVSGYEPRMRVGIHTGSPRPIGGDWLGVDVNITARIMDAAGNGGVMISGETYDALGDEELGEMGLYAKPHRRFLRVKMPGVPEGIRLYAIKRRSSEPGG